MWAGRAASTTALLTCQQKVRQWWAREREVLEISSLLHIVLFGSLTSRIMAFTFPFFVILLIQLNSTVFICAFAGPVGSSSTHQSIVTGENESGKRSQIDMPILQYLMLPISHRGQSHYRITGWFFSQPALSWMWRVIERVSSILLLRQITDVSVFVYFSMMLWVLLLFTAPVLLAHSLKYST